MSNYQLSHSSSTLSVDHRRLGSKQQTGRVDTGFHASFLQSFGLVGTLCEHFGCVNRLAWNDDGSILASTSDDLRVCLWDIERASLKCVFQTSHTNNIFGLRFLPCSDSRALVTGAMDSIVQYHMLHDDLTGLLETKSFYCHRARVKSIETEKSNPFLFFSAGEDGCVRQFDSRLPNFGCNIRSEAFEVNSTGSEYQSTNCLLKSLSSIKIFSMALNPVDSNLLVLATNHTHVNIFDRRMLTLSGPSNASVAEPVQSFVPPHVARFPNNGAHCTHAEFSPCGRSVLATYHTDHSYVFDLQPRKSSQLSKQVPSSSSSSSSSRPATATSSDIDGGGLCPLDSSNRANTCLNSPISESMTIVPAALPWRTYKDMSPDIIIRATNTSISQGKYMVNLGYFTLSYCLYSRADELGGTAVALCSSTTAGSSVEDISNSSTLLKRAKKAHARALYRRAMLFLDRRYKGDDDAGLTDMDRALQLNPKNTQYMLKRAVLLVRLRKPDECLDQLAQLEEHGGSTRSQKFSEAFHMLSRAARAQIDSRDRLNSLRQQREDNRRSNFRNVTVAQPSPIIAPGGSGSRNPVTRDFMRADETLMRSRASRLDIPVTEYTIAEAFQSIGSKRFHESPVLSSNEGSDTEGFDVEDSVRFNQHLQSTTDGTRSTSEGSGSHSPHAGMVDSGSGSGGGSGGTRTPPDHQKMLSSETDSRSERSDHSNSTPTSMEVEAEVAMPQRPKKPSRFQQRSVHDCGYTQRYVGAANIATDIKEAIFFGKNGEYIASGSDDGHLFIWDRLTGELLMSRLADADVVNCVLAHPFLPILVTSGLDDVIRIWGPNRLDGRFGVQSDYIRLFSRKLLSLEDRQKVHAGDESLLENHKLVIDDLPSDDGFEEDAACMGSSDQSLHLSSQALKDWSKKLSLDQQRKDQAAQDFLVSENNNLTSSDGISSRANSSPDQAFFSRNSSAAMLVDTAEGRDDSVVASETDGARKSAHAKRQTSGSVDEGGQGTRTGTSFESNSNDASKKGSSHGPRKLTENSSQSNSQSNSVSNSNSHSHSRSHSQMTTKPAISSSRATAEELSTEDRTVLTRATKGHALSIEEFIAAEKIISDNQKLMQLGPMPLLYQQMLNNLSWDGSSMDDSVAEESNRCTQS